MNVVGTCEIHDAILVNCYIHKAGNKMFENKILVSILKHLKYYQQYFKQGF
jgi:hypothetical protein